MIRNIVADASIIMKWLLPEHDSAQANALYSHEKITFTAPDIALAEITNALLKHTRQTHITSEEAMSALDNFYTKKLRFYPYQVFSRRALELADQLRHDSVYDCLYLALAEQQDCTLLTSDQKFLGKLAGSPFSRYAVALSSYSLP